MDDHQFVEEESGSVGELSTVCSQIVLKCLHLARIGRPDILWSVNKLARAVTKWTKTFDKCVSRLISWETQHDNADLDCSKSQTLLATLKTRINNRRGLVYFRKSHVCARKLAVQETDFSFTQFYRS